MTELGYYLMLRRGLSIHRADCSLIGRPAPWHWKGPFVSAESAMAFAGSVPATIIPKICENTCTDDDRQWLLDPDWTDGFPADQAVDVAERLRSRNPLAALHLGWFAVVQTMVDVGSSARLDVDGLHRCSPEVLTRLDQPFNRFVDPEVLGRLRAIGGAVDGLRIDQADGLREMARGALQEVRSFVEGAPSRSERLRTKHVPSPIADGVMALTRDDGIVMKLVRSDADHGFIVRHKSDWVPLVDMFDLEGLAWVGVTDRAIDVYDSCEWAGLRVPIKHYPPSINGPYWPDLIEDEEFIYDEDTDEYRRPDGVVEEDLYLLEFLGPDKQSHRLGYEATLRTDPDTGKAFKPIESLSLRTIAGFLNSTEGGTLLIGVTEDGAVHGIESDYASRPDTDQDPRDWFRGHLRSVIADSMGEGAGANVRSHIHHVRGHDICRVQVRPSAFPVHAMVVGQRPEDKVRHELFVRMGPTTRFMDPITKEKFIAQRWPE